MPTFTTSLPEDGVQAIIRNGDGSEMGRTALDYETVITASAGSVIQIPLGRGLRLAELLGA